LPDHVIVSRIYILRVSSNSPSQTENFEPNIYINIHLHICIYGERERLGERESLSPLRKRKSLSLWGRIKSGPIRADFSCGFSEGKNRLWMAPGDVADGLDGFSTTTLHSAGIGVRLKYLEEVGNKI
jgi:hypothetical protein